MSTRLRVGVVLLLVHVCWPSSSASAQAFRRFHSWEFEIDLGAISKANRLDGRSIAQFPAGQPLVDGAGVHDPSRTVPSWFFGDGATLFNEVSQRLGSNRQIRPLDPVFQRGAARRESSATIGLGVARWITGRVAAEFNLDYTRSAVMMTNETALAIEAARSSFLEGWHQLIVSQLTADGTVSDVSAENGGDRGGGQQLFATGGVRIQLYAGREFRAYAGTGAGIGWLSGRTPTAVLTGIYAFNANAAGIPRFAEQDNLTVRVQLNRSRSTVGMVHGGFEMPTGLRNGLRLDLAAYVFTDSFTTLVSAQPRFIPRPPGALVSSDSSPSLWFSNSETLGPSSLSGPALVDFPAHVGNGRQVQIRVVVSYFMGL
jgi:hypothetical protein